VWFAFMLALVSPDIDKVHTGMTAAEVRRLLGAPTSMSRQVLHARYVEQWNYRKLEIWIDFEGSKGVEPRVRSVNPPPR
jgi:hypothetical protein